ncbi:ABC transporter ATP-binding protein [Raineyella sp. W15-4]|uniref:ABC transporter ATP-binding protein n=1 Tax=Raineyella sp. W15-4 TaxID=3081651 RepID=UPI002953D416|nr:ABC transporter ATP-binding protein [Raineyella sp. W15-4]WOQ16850.1 ABC transporter ATP-binding protein [Raineyella sp. W15-4]
MKHPLNRLLVRHLSPYSGHLLGVVALQFAATIASLFLPTLNAAIIDDGVAKGDTPFIWSHGAIMLGVSLVQVVCQISAVLLGSMVAMRFGRDTRAAIFSRVLSFSSREVNRFGAPSLITRNTNDVQQVQMLVLMTCIMILGAPITMVGGVVMALRSDWHMSWLIVAAVVVLGVSIGLLVSRMVPLFQSMQKRIDVLNRVLREQISGIRVVRAFVREPYEAERFAAANGDLTGTALAVGRLMASMFPVVMLILNVSSVAVLWFGAYQIDAGHIQVGQLTAFLQYLMQILMSGMMAVMMIVMVPRAAVCADRIMEVLDTESSVVPPAEPVRTVTSHGTVALTGVGFTYPGADSPVLQDISFTMAPGRTTAIIGSTGSGKTTLVSLLPRLHDATEGTVEVDGVDVRRLEPELLWSRIGLVPQKPYLFTGTVASNLRYGNPDATDAELWHALEVAQARDFVEAMPGGLDAPIAQGGTNVSGGQRQRLSIARALVRQPDLYIFDDSFSALDVATDARLRAALAREIADEAVLIVGQRVSTIAGADQILVLEDGRIVGRGTHQELLADNPTYREIVESQMSAEEAAA